MNMAPVKKQNAPLGSTYLRAWRDHCGLDQDTAASAIGISRTLLSKMENGRSPYTQRTLEAAAQLYKCLPAQLLVNDPSRGTSLIELFETLERLDEQAKQRAIRVIKAHLDLRSPESK